MLNLSTPKKAIYANNTSPTKLVQKMHQRSREVQLKKQDKTLSSGQMKMILIGISILPSLKTTHKDSHGDDSDIVFGTPG